MAVGVNAVARVALGGEVHFVSCLVRISYFHADVAYRACRATTGGEECIGTCGERYFGECHAGFPSGRTPLSGGLFPITNTALAAPVLTAGVGHHVACGRTEFGADVEDAVFLKACNVRRNGSRFERSIGSLDFSSASHDVVVACGGVLLEEVVKCGIFRVGVVCLYGIERCLCCGFCSGKFGKHFFGVNLLGVKLEVANADPRVVERSAEGDYHLLCGVGYFKFHSAPLPAVAVTVVGISAVV